MGDITYCHAIQGVEAKERNRKSCRETSITSRNCSDDSREFYLLPQICKGVTSSCILVLPFWIGEREIAQKWLLGDANTKGDENPQDKLSARGTGSRHLRKWWRPWWRRAHRTWEDTVVPPEAPPLTRQCQLEPARAMPPCCTVPGPVPLGGRAATGACHGWSWQSNGNMHSEAVSGGSEPQGYNLLAVWPYLVTDPLWASVFPSVKWLLQGKEEQIWGSSNNLACSRLH